MMSEDWDVIVVGGGVIGSWTALHLARSGVRTLILEQFYLPHARGSSNGQSRIMRFYYDQDHYSGMLDETKRQWEKLERDANTTLFIKTGILVIQDKDAPKIASARKMMTKYNMPHEYIPPGQIESKYPMLRYGPDFQALLDKEAGVLLASKIVMTLQRLFLESGGTIIDGRQVTEVKIIEDGKIKVMTRDGPLTAGKVVITAGPWAKDLLEKTGLSLPLKTMTGIQYYFKERQINSGCHLASRGMPMMIHQINTPESYQFYYSKPESEYPGLVKVASRGEPMLKYCHPDKRDCADDHMRDHVCRYVQEHMPYLETTPSIVDPCVYTMTPDRDYIVDKHPLMPNVYIGAGFSGHGFKLAPVVGKLLTEMALQRPLSYDITPFSIKRFNKAPAAKL